MDMYSKMFKILGFCSTEQIYSSTNTNIYRGIKDNQPFILKALKDDYPSIEAIANLKYEYSIICGLHHDNR
jgi:hypothetical protein